MINPIETDERRGCTSASNALADSLCAARHLLQRGKTKPPNPYADSGARIHAALATGKRDGLKLEEAQTVERCLEIERNKLLEFFGEDGAGKAQAFAEDPANPERSRLWVRVRAQNNGQAVAEYEHSCRPDKFYRLKDRALVIEYKTLFGDVPESPRNLQLRDQQIIIRGNLLITGDIGVVVIQPHVELNPQICVYTAADSKRAETEMFNRVIASNTPGQTPVPGEQQCKYCLAKTSCKAYLQHASALVPAVMTLMDVPMELWEPQHRARAAAALKPARDLLDNIEEHIRMGLEKDPQFCPGWYLKPGAKQERITDPQECFERFVKLGGKGEQFLRAVSIVKAKLKEMIADVTGAKGKKLDGAMAVLLDGITEEKQNRASLKPAEEP